MNSDFEMAEMHRQKPKKKFMAENNASSSPSLSSYFPVNSSHNLLQQQANPFPFTQPFFQEHHFVQPFFDDPVREHGGNSNLLLPLSFKLGSSGGEIGQRNNALGDDAPLHRNCHGGGGGGGSPDAMIQCWENQEDSALKQRFWKPLSAEFPNGNEKECPKENDDEEKRKEEEMSRHETEEKTKFSFFDGELEAIYRQADIAETAQTASGSALTAENFPASASRHSQMPDNNAEAAAGKGRRDRKRRKLKKDVDNDDEYRSMGEFFESLVKRVMDHQEELHSKFLETMERLERERVGREEAWRKQEQMNLEREADDRANQRALASSREAAILSYLEKITGQKITLPSST